MKLKFAGVGLTFIAALVIGCGDNKTPDSNTTSTPSTGAPAATPTNGAAINGAGATFPAPIYKKWIADYQSTAAVNYLDNGSAQGIDALKNKTVDFGASDAPLTTEEEAAIPNVAHIPTVGGAVVLTYKLPGDPAGLKMTPDIIAGIYLGSIKKWNDPALVAANPGVTLPDLKILPVYRSDGSGTTYVFTSYLTAVNAAWAAGPKADKSVKWPVGNGQPKNGGVAKLVAGTPGAVGYVELTYAAANKLPVAAVKNKAGNFITPDVDSTAAAIADFADALAKDIKTPTINAPGARSYPIASLTYVLLVKSGGAAHVAAAAKFWDWALQPTQQAEVKALSYAPLPDALVKTNLATLKPMEDLK